MSDNFDQAQSPRLGQLQPPENPGIRMVTFDDLPEVAYQGQIVYLTDLGYILIYDGSAWQSVGNASVGTGAKIYVGDTDPSIANTINDGDMWYHTTPKVLNVWQSAAWQVTSVADGSVTTTKIADLAVTNAKIANLAVDTGKVNSLSVSKLLVSNLDNLIEDGDFEGAQLNWSGTGSIVSVTGPLGNTTKTLQQPANSSSQSYTYSPNGGINVKPGEVYWVSAWVVRQALTSAGGFANVQATVTLNGGSTATTTVASLAVTSMTVGTWAQVAGQYTVPANKNQLSVSVQSTGTNHPAFNWDQVVTTRAADGQLIVDGAVTATKVSATAIDGKTITGPIIQTTTGLGSGSQGMQVSSDTSGGVIKYWTGDGSETGPGLINPELILPPLNYPGSATPAPGLMISSPNTGGRTHLSLIGSLGLFSYDDLYVEGSITAHNDITTGLGPGDLVTGNSMSCSKAFATGHTTSTTGSATVKYNASNELVEITSLSINKLEQEELSLEDAQKLLDLTPKTWYDRYDAEIAGSTEGLHRAVGLVAEDVEEHAPMFAHYVGDELRSVQYDRLPVALLWLIKDQQEQISELTSRLDTMEKM